VKKWTLAAAALSP